MFGQTTSSLLLLLCQGLEELIPHSEHTFVSSLGRKVEGTGRMAKGGSKGLG